MMTRHEMNTIIKLQEKNKRSWNTTYMKSGFRDAKHRMINTIHQLDHNETVIK